MGRNELAISIPVAPAFWGRTNCFVVNRLLLAALGCLDLSKTFDRVNWDALWLTLHDHGISEHLVRILQLIYSNQSGEVQGEHSNSDFFPSTLEECDKDVC